jgi:thermostable 8-oxoguanine DNA glycosylase
MQEGSAGQIVWEWFDSRFSEVSLPPRDAEVVEGVPWGSADELFSPAYWAVQVWLSQQKTLPARHRIGTTLLEEATACVLGGHGMRAEIALAAFYHLRSKGLLSSGAATGITEIELASALSDPLLYQNRSVYYRFPRQKAAVLAPVLRNLAVMPPPATDHRRFRDWFLQFRGVGPKTASWITRNWLDSDSVAILDIHVCRAGMLSGLFSIRDKPADRYFEMEERFLAFSRGLRVCSSLLDSIMWQHMRTCPAIVASMLRYRFPTGPSEFIADIPIA